MVGSILGNRVIRKEDPKFLTTGGMYLDDLNPRELTGAAHVAYVRSPVAHGTITSIDVTDAVALPGVVAVLSGADLELQPIPSSYNPTVARPFLAMDRVRYVGEPIAAVVAETREAAADAAEAVIVEIEPLDAYVDVEAAMSGQTLLFDAAPANVVFDTTAMGMPDLTGDEYFADCEVVTSGRFVNQRVAPCPLEVRTSAVAWVDGRLHQWISTQHAHGVKERFVAANGLTGDDVRVITPDVGGGFGAKISCYPEEMLLGTIAKHVGRPVRWQETRSESMLALGHGRGQVQYVTIGGRRDGTVTHYQLRVIQDSGAFCDMAAVLAPFMTRPMASGVYDIANIECRTTSVVTNTTPTVAYRGAGRPEATAAIERAMDLFAAELGMDPADVRRKNLIPPFQDPHTTAIDQTYDCGDYVGALDRALDAAGYAELRAEQVRRRQSGDAVQLGIGVSAYVEITGNVPPMGEAANIEILTDGRAIVHTGTSPHGQGHETAWAMIASARTGIPIEHIELRWGDTDRISAGGGTMGSRSLQVGGVAVDKAAAELVDLARSMAAVQLEAAEADIELDLERGVFHVAGTPAVTKSWGELATAAGQFGAPLIVDARFDAAKPTFPFGAHVAIVEVDTETGLVRLVRHVAVDDAGRVINPLILEGQIHGGVAQGAAQALLEEVRYDDDGNPITANLADYGMISAAELPSFEVVHMETPTPVNPLGAKGIGESGTIGSTPAVQSAVVDAVSHLGIRHIDMPATPERVWQAIRDAVLTGRSHVLVDLDGTLSDSEPGISSSLRRALALEGLPVPDDDVLRQAIGPPFELGLPLIGVPGDRLWAVIEHYRERYEDGGLFETTLYDGVVEMLDALRAHGLVLALATAKPEVTARRVVEHLGLADRFTVLAGATFEPGRRTKAEVIGHALHELDIEAGPHVVMVGDRDHDVHGAQVHGIDSVGVLWGYGGESELTLAGATALAATPADVVALLTGRVTDGRSRALA